MLFRFSCLLAFALGGCAATYTSPIGNDEAELAQLRANNKGMILIHTSLADGSCVQVLAQIIQPDASGRFGDGKAIFLRHKPVEGPSGPVEIVLPAGEYGIVEIACTQFALKDRRTYRARVETQGNVLQTTIYQQPIAKFTVTPGEFIDVGSINVIRVREPEAGKGGEFAATVTPIEQRWMPPLVKAKPNIYALRIQRLMTTPGPVRLTDRKT